MKKFDQLLSSLNILIVDDDSDLRESLSELLANFGCNVISAHDGQSAINQFVKHNPDFTLIDIRMPEMNGIEAVKKICYERNPDGKIIFMSGNLDRQAIATENFDCVVDFLTKPFTTEELLKIFKKFLFVKVQF